MTATTLPPLDFMAADFRHDPWPVYRYYREHAPIYANAHDRCLYLFRYRDIKQVMLSKSFIVDHPFRSSKQVLGNTILDIEGPAHQRLRQLAATRLKPTQVRKYVESLIMPIINAELAPLIDAGPFDFMEVLAARIPVRVIGAILELDLDEADWIYETIEPIVRYIDNPRESLAKAMEARDMLSEYILASLSRAEKGASNSGVLRAMLAQVSDGLTLDEIVSTILLLLAAGTETTTCALGNLVTCLLMHPSTLAELRRGELAAADVAREVLRWQTSLSITVRIACEDTQIGAGSVKKNTFVKLCLASANRDEQVFTDPDAWDPHRKERELMSFGAGKHACLGMGLAIAELEGMLSALSSRDVHLALAGGGAVPAIVGGTFRRPDTLPIELRSRP